MGRLIKDGIPFTGSSGSADMVKYDNTNSGLTALTAQDAIDEVNVNLNHRPVNNNILINSNFANPVNQRGQTEYTYSGYGQMYSIDRWCFDRVGQTLMINDGKITLTTDGSDHMALRQFIENLQSGVYTLSAKVNGVIYSKTFTFNHSYIDFEFENGIRFCFSYVSSTKHSAIVVVFDKEKYSTIDIEWVKCELGDVATPYVPRLYAEELQLCQRYYQKYDIEAVPYFVTSSMIQCVASFKELIRLNYPTATINHYNLVINGENADGFTVTTHGTDCDAVLFRCTKDSHGYTINTGIRLNVNISLDAEL